MTELHHVTKKTVESVVKPKLDLALNTFDRDMQKILKDKKLSDFDKWVLYTHTLAQYTSVLKSQQLPQQHIITETATPVSGIDLDTLHHGVRTRAEKLMKLIPGINANESEELILPHRGVSENSNYRDIFNDMLTNSTRKKPIPGQSETIDFLKSDAPLLPEDLIINKKYKQRWLHY